MSRNIPRNKTPSTLNAIAAAGSSSGKAKKGRDKKDKDADRSAAAPDESNKKDKSEAQHAVSDNEASKSVGNSTVGSLSKVLKELELEQSGTAADTDKNLVAKAVNNAKGANVSMMNTSEIQTHQSNPTTQPSAPSHPADSPSGTTHVTPGAGGGWTGNGTTEGSVVMSGGGESYGSGQDMTMNQLMSQSQLGAAEPRLDYARRTSPMFACPAYEELEAGR